MKCSFLDWFESSRRPKGCAGHVLNPLIFSRCVEFRCHWVGVLVGWRQTGLALCSSYSHDHEQ